MTENKAAYFQKLISLFEECPKVLVVGTDNVGSSHMQKMRLALRGQAVMLMGKNTMIRKAIRQNLTKLPKLDALLPHIKGNVGFIFVPAGGDLAEIKKKCDELRVEAPARAGSIAPCDVVVPAGPTGLEPTQTSFLQALNIGSKIVKGQVEIVSDVSLLKKGDKVLPGHAALLAKIGINPFSYGLKPVIVFDEGAVYEPSLLEITEADLLAKFVGAARNVAALSLQLNLPNAASVPTMVREAFRNLLAIALQCDTVKFKEAEEFKAALASGAAAAAAAPPAAAAAAATPAPAAAKGGKEPAKPKAPEPEPEDEDVGMGGLFD